MIVLQCMLLLALFSNSISSQLTVPSIFASHMVLPAGKQVQFWGSTKVDGNITVLFKSSTSRFSLPTQSLNGDWSVMIPPQVPSQTQFSVFVSDTNGNSLLFQDVVFGMVYLCSGQSNMELGVACTVNATAELEYSDKIGNMGVRVIMVPTSFEYCDVKQPLYNFTPAIPWERASRNVIPGMSAVCYYFGKEQIQKYPNIPVGLIATSWGGTKINVWMSSASLNMCGGFGGENRLTQNQIKENNFNNKKYDIGLDYLKPKTNKVGDCFPTADSTLWYSMIYPFLSLPIQGILWYQGESNADKPEDYERCFPAMIDQWRNDFNINSGGGLDIPFFFVQISCWPNQDNGIIAVQRYAQTFALTRPLTAMAVSADIGDPAGALHPIHPPFKQEISRRLFLAADNIMFGNKASPKQGPTLLKTIVQLWDPSWGNFHFGNGGISNACNTFICFGIQLIFDQNVFIRPVYGRDYGMGSGFEVVTSHGQIQPVSMYSLGSQPNVIQLNCTKVFGSNLPLVQLRYAWHDYPVMTVFNSFGLPLAPFNISITPI